MSCSTVAPDKVTIVAGDYYGRVHFLRLELPTIQPNINPNC